MSAVDIPDEAVNALIMTAVLRRSPDGSPNLAAGLEAAAPLVVAGVLEGMISALDGHFGIYEAMGDADAARGVKRCIQHLRDYKACVDRDIQSAQVV